MAIARYVAAPAAWPGRAPTVQSPTRQRPGVLSQERLSEGVVGGARAHLGYACLAAAAGAGACRHRQRRRWRVRCSATKVEAETETGLAPWEIEVETEEERQARYKREAEEMKLKWDARRLEEKQSAERRIAFAAKEKERAMVYGPRDPIMEAYEARMYEEARVLEVCRKQREVYERTKAFKLGRPLPPKGTPYVELRPPPVRPPKPEDFDVSGRYDPQEDVEEAKYKAPDSYVSPTGPAPPARHMRGAPRAAWENPPYMPPSPYQRPSNFPKPGTVTELPQSVIAAREAAEAPGALPTLVVARNMKISELRKVMEDAGLPAGGSKEEMLDRIATKTGEKKTTLDEDELEEEEDVPVGSSMIGDV